MEKSEIPLRGVEDVWNFLMIYADHIPGCAVAPQLALHSTATIELGFRLPGSHSASVGFVNALWYQAQSASELSLPEEPRAEVSCQDWGLYGEESTGTIRGS